MRRRHTRSLIGDYSAEEDVNPNSYITNIADCMLVLVLGFLVALITRYNIDLNKVNPEDIIGVEIAMDADQDGKVDENYERRGSVYYDKESGNFYYVAGDQTEG